eukprot:gene26110-biopygen14105
MSRGGCSRPESIEAADPKPESKRGIANFDSGHKHHPLDMSSPETGHCYGVIIVTVAHIRHCTLLWWNDQPLKFRSIESLTGGPTIRYPV